MGYYACGSGSATLKLNIDTDALSNIFNNIIAKNSCYMEYDIDTKINTISFWETDSHWHEENTMDFLNALIPYIDSGSAIYDGEDDCHWRYQLINGEWIDQPGTIYYATDDMIKDLEEQGFKVINTSKMF